MKNRRILAAGLSFVMALSCFGAMGGKTVFADSANAVEINETTFPDAGFREVVKTKYDPNKDGKLSDEEIASVDRIDCNDLDIRDLKGIEYFTELELLYCENCNITSLDMSKNIKLLHVCCDGNNLTSLNISGCTKLEYLSAYQNKLKSIDVSGCPELKALYVSSNEISSLDLSKCPALFDIDCSYNPISTLDVSKNTELAGISAANCDLTELDISACIHLQNLYCEENNITSMDLSHNPELLYFWFFRNKLTTLDVSKNTQLKYLDCSNNSLTELKGLQNLPDLERLDVSFNSLSGIDLSKNTKLKLFDCTGFNYFETLDLSQNPELTRLDCCGVGLASLDLSHNPKLEEVYCYANFMTSITLGKQEKLHDLRVFDNYISSVDISECPLLLALISEVEPALYDPYGESVIFGSVKEISDFKANSVLYDVTARLYTEKPGNQASFQDFVERLYTVALGRASEAEGKAYWVDQVEKKGLTGADCARFFLLDSPEFLGRNLPDDQFVETLYQTFFGRESEADGKAYWLGRLASGSSKAELVNDFIESVEWCNICASYGVKSGAVYHKATMASENAKAFATRLYTCCLGRMPEADGLKYWSVALTTLDANGYQAASLFFTSKEFKDFGVPNEIFIVRLYTTFMGRRPDESGFDYWMNLLEYGTSREDALKAFAGCQEFQDICNQYGIERGAINE